MSKKLPKVLLIGTGGGHLTEVMLATENVPMRRVIATFWPPHSDETLSAERKHYLIDPHKSLWKYAFNALQSFYVILRERPDAIVNAGGGISIACSLFGKAIGAKLIFVETGARVTTPSKTGKFLYKYSDLFIVQWEGLLKFYPKAICGGPML